jgi:hypothetical protein
MAYAAGQWQFIGEWRIRHWSMKALAGGLEHIVEG